MPKQMQKIYCYVDETGQDTGGELFLAAVVLKNKEQLDSLRSKLEDIETVSGKKSSKWFRMSFRVKQAYLSELLTIKELRSAIYYSTYHGLSIKEYYPLISLTIAKSIIFQQIEDYQATITIDGLKSTETDGVRRELKKLGIRYRKIKGLKDEQEILLRLADSMAGFLRDATEGQKYAQKYLVSFREAKIIVEV